MALLSARPGASLVLLEKEEQLAAHQTGHNSGVIHAGIYYAPGSFKSKLCRQGMQATKDFCDAHNIRYETCGKLILATSEDELGRMKKLYENALENGAEIEKIDRAELERLEPNVTGVAGLLATETGIVDYKEVSRAMARSVELAGGEVRLNFEVTEISQGGGDVRVTGNGDDIHAAKLIICGGLQSDRLACMAGFEVDFRIVPFRGEYYQLLPGQNGIVNHLIYPVPDPSMPFLGIHLTRMIDGSVTVGPNAVLGLAREGYAPRSFDPRDAADLALFPGFWRLILANWKHAAGEVRNSLSKQAYLDACRKYCPSLTMEDLLPREAGIRAQAVTADGTPSHDFIFRESERILAVCNAPSPAATSAIPLGKMVAEWALAK